jgi:hypothetical protein
MNETSRGALPELLVALNSATAGDEQAVSAKAATPSSRKRERLQ